MTAAGCFEIISAGPGTPSNCKGSLQRLLVSAKLAVQGWVPELNPLNSNKLRVFCA